MMGWCQRPPSKSSPLELGSITLSCFFSAWKAGSMEGNSAWALPLRETLLLRPQAHLHTFFLMPPLTGSGCRSEAVCPQRGPIPSPSAAQVPPPPARMGLLNSISKKTLLSWEFWLDQHPATNGRLCSTSAASHRPSRNLELLGLGLGRKRGKGAALSQTVSSITLVVRRV